MKGGLSIARYHILEQGTTEKQHFYCVGGSRDRGLMISDWGLLISDWGLLISDWGLTISDWGLLISDCGQIMTINLEFIGNLSVSIIPLIQTICTK